MPIFAYQDVFQLRFFASIALTAPLVYLGAVAGRKFLEWIPQLWFNRVVLGCTALAGLWLLANYFFKTA